jgi:hypothetical protein
MIITTGSEGLALLVKRQVDSVFLCDAQEAHAIVNVVSAALDRAEKCFSASSNKYFRNDADKVILKPFNTIVFGTSPKLILKHRPSEYFYGRSPFKAHRNRVE